MDGFLAGPNRGPGNPLGDGGVGIHSWAFDQAAFRKNLHLGQGGETGADNQVLERLLARTGANIMGKRMFEEGERGWPEDAPFHGPVFVLTHERRQPWKRKGGTTFHFVNGGVQDALVQAKAAAGTKDVRISGGADTLTQFLNARLVDEVHLAVAPLVMGAGLRLLDRVDATRVAFTPTEAVASKGVTHLWYAVGPASGMPPA